ncbi:ATPase, V1 complex, subunit H [Gautieria morchelliformis]|nr:ATPase, V1 complex, subunit H [Gautieria morchelliformis]
MSISLVSNPYLDEASAKIRSKPVPWEGYQRAGLLTSEELSLIKRVDRQPRAKVESLLVTSAQSYAQLYLKLLKKLARVDTLQWLLVVIADALADHEERLPLFIKAVEWDPELPYAPLLRALDTNDEFTQLKAAQILTVLLSSEPSTLPPEILAPFVNTLTSIIQTSNTNNINKLDVAVQCLESLLTRTEVRSAVWEKPKILSGLVDILKSNPGPQMSYQVGFCFWLITFEPRVAENINAKYDIIPVLTDIAQSAVKEKVIRVVIATFRNLVSRAPTQNLPAMFVVKLLPFVRNLAARKWSDDEVIEDIQYLNEELSAHFQDLTTYDQYTSELSSGHLIWSPVHDSEAFWSENAMKLNESDYHQLKALVKLLNEATDPLVLAVAVHDVGQYVRHCDRGKRVIEDLGAKRRVMELMSHDNPDVRYRAIISVQRLVGGSWRR